MNKEELSGLIINSAITVHNEMGYGFLEKIYRLSLKRELELHGIEAETEKRIVVNYKGMNVGEYSADLLVENLFIIETKCVSRLVNPHIMQTKHYLRATGVNDGLLFNFNNPRLEWKRVYR